MERVLAAFALVATLLVAAPGFAERISDPTGLVSDPENQGYVEVARNPSAPAVRVCNENGNTPLGDAGTGYVWVNPRGENQPATYGHPLVGFGDYDGENGSPSRDGDGDTNDDCP